MHKIKISLMTVPLLFVLVNVVYLTVLFPIYSAPPGYDQDPAYSYLFNGLLLLDGQAPWQVDHPGTPLQFLCAMSILFAHFLFFLGGTAGSYGVIDGVLFNPERYLFVISLVLLTINAITLFYFGKKIAQSTKNIWVALLCQLSSLAFTIMSPKAGYLAPEALLITASYLLIALLSPYIFEVKYSKINHSESSNVVLGIICGFGLIVKVTFFPMIGLVFLLSDKRKIFKVGIYALLTCIILLIPTYQNFDRLFAWLWNIASHSGLHGSGKDIFIQPTQLLQNIASVIDWYKPLYIVTFLLFCLALLESIYIYRTTKSRTLTLEQIRTPFVLVGVIAAQTLIVAKHPGAHYLIPALPLAFVGFAWLLIHIENLYSHQLKKPKIQYQFFALCTAVVFIVFSVVPTFIQINTMRIQRKAQDSSLEIINSELGKYSDPLVICAFRCTLPKYATLLGLTYAPGLLDRPIVNSLLHNFYEYNFLVKEMIAPGVGSFKLDELPERLTKHSKVFLITPKSYPDLEVFKLEKVISPGVLTLYEITGLATSSGIKQSRDQTN